MAFRKSPGDGPYSAPAGADFSSAGIHTFKSLNSSGQFVDTGVGAMPFGLLDNAPAFGKSARVDYEPGCYKAILGGTVAIGDGITVGTSAKAIKAVSSGGVIVGTALMAGVSGDVVTIEYHRYLGTI